MIFAEHMAIFLYICGVISMSATLIEVEYEDDELLEYISRYGDTILGICMVFIVLTWPLFAILHFCDVIYQSMNGDRDE